MKIAILGWGSLVWDPASLKEHLEGDGEFIQGGPKLPIEFSRISKDGRLTLVIDEHHGTPVPTRVATSRLSNLGDDLYSSFESIDHCKVLGVTLTLVV
jgi:hypothetical protein